MYEFVFHDDIKDDLARIRVRAPSAEKRLLAALEAAGDDEELMSRLHVRHYRTYDEHDTDVKSWVVARQLGYDLHRIRFFHIEENGYQYRVIYALDHVDEYCYVLAILRRDEIDYDDPNNQINLRIFRAYADLGL